MEQLHGLILGDPGSGLGKRLSSSNQPALGVPPPLVSNQEMTQAEHSATTRSLLSLFITNLSNRLVSMPIRMSRCDMLSWVKGLANGQKTRFRSWLYL